jgi:hypothetical protein
MIDEIDNDELYYIDYSCNVCGQMGTARFIGENLLIDDDGVVLVKKTIYCCECKSDDLNIEEVGA